MEYQSLFFEFRLHTFRRRFFYPMSYPAGTGQDITSAEQYSLFLMQRPGAGEPVIRCRQRRTLRFMVYLPLSSVMVFQS
ncbi:MAG: hypothetical protein JXA41_15190 [Deltaproteobacteria bacterium]|nr:hypothetical protein [Deltaproteobacteria bacterium]